jgi:hypothetical protein
MPDTRVELDKLKGKKLFSKFDIKDGYHNILIKPKDRHKAAFKTPSGTYIPKVMTFGLRNAPSVFQRAMNRDLRPLKQKYPDHFTNFMDDVCIMTDDSEEGRALHRKIVHEFLNCLERHSYFLKVSKCQFKQTSINFLGYTVKNGVACIDPTKISGLRSWPRTLKTVKEVRQVLGVLGYQQPFIRDLAKLARPLTALTKKGQPFIWTEECRQSLDTLIEQVCDDPELTAAKQTI